VVALEVDAGGVRLEGALATEGSVVDASHFGVVLAQPHLVGPGGKVVAARFGPRTIFVAFAGPAGADGVAHAEEVVFAAPAAAGGAGPVEEAAAAEAARRFEFLGMSPPAWEAAVREWAARNAGAQFDESVHPPLLADLWAAAFPGRPAPARRDPAWGELGFQQRDPASDFRGAGMAGLAVLLRFAQARPELFRAMLGRSKGDTPQVPAVRERERKGWRERGREEGSERASEQASE
jgi:hypothetical protein